MKENGLELKYSGKKKDPWKFMFFEKMLFFSKLENKKSFNFLSMKNFHIASFSIDTGSKLYADKIDSLHNFVLSFLQGLLKKKRQNIEKKKNKNSLDKIITLKTNAKKKKVIEILKKETSLFCLPIFEKWKFELFVRNYEELKKFLQNIKMHRKNFNFSSRKKFLEHKSNKNSRIICELSWLKTTYFQNILATVESENLYLSEIFLKIQKKKKKKKLISFTQDFLESNENLFKIFPPKFHLFPEESIRKTIFSQKFSETEKNPLKKKKKKVFFYDLLKSENSHFDDEKGYICPNFYVKNEETTFLNSWNRYFCNKISLIKTTQQKACTRERDTEIFEKFFSKKGAYEKNEEEVDYYSKKVFTSMGNSMADQKQMARENRREYIIKVQDIIIFLQDSHIGINRNLQKKLKNSKFISRKHQCFFIISQPIGLFKRKFKISLKKKEKKFTDYYVCFLHCAFQTKFVIVGNMKMDNFFYLQHN